MNGLETEEQMERYIQALLRELAQQEAVGNKEEAEACRESLRAVGYKAEKPQERAEKRGPGRPRKSA